MDLGDLIIPLLIIGSVIVQWLGSSKKGGEEQGAPPDLPTDTPTESSEQQGDPSWDDLMEALGRPSAPPEVPPAAPQPSVQQTPEPTPPPVIPVHQEPEQPYVNLLDQQREKLKEKQRQLAAVKKQTQTKLNKSTRSSAPTVSKPVGALDLRNMLDNRRSLRQAIVVNEILQPPVSLR